MSCTYTFEQYEHSQHWGPSFHDCQSDIQCQRRLYQCYTLSVSRLFEEISLSTPHLRSFEDVSVLFGSFSFGTEWRWTHIGVLVCHESSPKPPYCTWLVYDYPQWGPNGGSVIWFITLLEFGEDGIIFCFLVAGSKTTTFFFAILYFLAYLLFKAPTNPRMIWL